YRRKTLRNALKKILDEQDFNACDIDPGSRPERLNLHDFARLAERLYIKK
ncbi:MAG: 16S rRNA (adenine(1518)-N(6)/adenine(1519)-N(6))-dimethyltransferase, partial [Gammaproteobacteria bacterium]|nr:16S rRNA (adenine(1518)-N(6)/adenine(1519)-N(6))-dimethyltransferase [Gammaproteobacteria bacterium]